MLGQIARRPITLSFDDDRISQFQNAFPLMRELGMVGTFYIDSRILTSGYPGFMSPVQVKALQDAGNEIGSHSATHSTFTELTDEQIVAECVESKTTLGSYGFVARNFRYPRAMSNEHIDSIVSQYYRSGCYEKGYMKLPIRTFKVPIQGAWNAPLETLKSYVDYAYVNDLWLNINFHNISNEEPTGNSNITISDFTELLDYIQSRNFKTLTINQVLGPEVGALDILLASLPLLFVLTIVGAQELSKVLRKDING